MGAEGFAWSALALELADRRNASAGIRVPHGQTQPSRSGE
jgi:hypothetical protein